MAESCVESEGEIAWAAKQIASGPLGLIRYAPEPWAVQRCCFDNVERKVSLDGGRARYGWMFQKRIAPQGAYMVATHHAVWHAPSDELVDVTPMVDEPCHRSPKPARIR